MTDFVQPKAVEMAADVKELKQEDLATKQTDQEDLASTKQTDEEDWLSSLPDDILSSILERLQLHEAARTSILSRRWRYLFIFRSQVVIDADAFHYKDNKSSMLALGDLAQRNACVVKATKSMLAQSSQCPISLLRIRFHLVEESIGIIHRVDGALSDRKIATVHFLILPEGHRTEDELVTNGRRFMRFFYAGPRAFTSLSYLHIHHLMLSIDDVVNVLNTCKKLEHLIFQSCECGFESVLQIEHPHLTTLVFDGCIFGKIELNWLPSLKCFSYWTWFFSQDQYPLSLGYVPQLSTLNLRNQASIMHKSIRLSELLCNATISLLDLDFECERIWVEPEAPKVFGPLFQYLQILILQNIHEECDLDWTMFFLEAAPLLKQVSIKVWDHACYNSAEEWQDMYQKGYNLPRWEARADLKHCNLKVLSIKGYQVEEKFTTYIRRVVEAAANLKLILLSHSGSCEQCEFSPSTRYPRTHEERLQIKEQIEEWRSSPLKIGFEPLECRPSPTK
ncbi:unnamed protein product [Urochloa decumbens]|uniref:F-box domain-containing protein n=1 Tax=Urochloa decumbens TaxID=240449 RepID=A0ABC9CAH1_9POAL